MHWPYYLRLGLVRFTMANMILYTVQGKVPVGIMAVIMSFVPIFTCSISLIVRIERFSGCARRELSLGLQVRC